MTDDTLRGPARCQICTAPKPVVDPEDETSTRYGACDSERCTKLRALEMPKGPMFNIGWLKQSNAISQTANEFKQEIYETAREEGRDIQRAR